jgi:hypothetical protein
MTCLAAQRSLGRPSGRPSRWVETDVDRRVRARHAQCAQDSLTSVLAAAAEEENPGPSVWIDMDASV